MSQINTYQKAVAEHRARIAQIHAQAAMLQTPRPYWDEGSAKDPEMATSRWMEVGNNTLHISKPYLRAPVLPVYTMGQGTVLIYALMNGLLVNAFCFTLTAAVFNRFPITPLSMLVGAALVYIPLYRHRIKLGIAKKFRDKINNAAV